MSSLRQVLKISGTNFVPEDLNINFTMALMELRLNWQSDKLHFSLFLVISTLIALARPYKLGKTGLRPD